MSKTANVFGVWFCACLVLGLAGPVTTSPAMAAGLIAQDLDHDSDVDVGDFALLSECLSGSNVSHDGSPTCQEADIDYDGDVDMADFGIMQKCFSGVGVPGNPACACVRPKANLAVSVAPTSVYSGQIAYVTVGSSQEGVSYQLRNNANNANSGSLMDGTGDDIILLSAALSSTTTFNVLATNALGGGCSVPLSTTVAVTVIPYTPNNKIGVHVVNGSRNGYGPFLQQCAAAGKPVALVKTLDDFGAGDDPKLYSPQTLVIGRKNDLPSCSWGSNCDLQGFDAQADPSKPTYIPPAEFAQMVFNALSPIWSANRNRIDVWEICNEWSEWWAYQADFYIAMMNIAEPQGYRIALYGCSAGNPPESSWPDIARACARAKAHGNHILSLHEYGLSVPDLPQFPNFEKALLQDRDAAEALGYEGDVVLRYRRLYNYLIPRNADCPLALTEVGQGGGGGFVGTDLFVQDFGWYDTQLRQDPYVIGCAAWTLGNWAGANFQAALPALTNYIIAH